VIWLVLLVVAFAADGMPEPWFLAVVALTLAIVAVGEAT
jgi:hypothetical protein